VARSASLTGRWLPTYGWWPHPERFQASVVISPYHSTLEHDTNASFATVVRGYAGSGTPVWEHDMGTQRIGEERVLVLSELDVPPPPDSGAILEVHTVREDRQPTERREPLRPWRRHRSVQAIGMWIDAVSPDGGGYVIPTQPIRGAKKVIARDDVQVVPGIIATGDVDTDLLLLNVIGKPVEVRLVASSPEGLVQESAPFELGPYSAWYGSLRRTVPRVRRLLESGGGVGSLAVYSNHRLLPHFGFRRDGGPVGSMDHTAPIFAN
jgi:hypothetical protein